MKVSIIIPTHKRQDELKRCLASLGLQRYPKADFEVIVVEDGLNYHASYVIDEIKEKYKINIIYTKQPKKSPAAARNKGIKLAEGQIIGFIDDDAIASQDWIGNAIRYFQDDNVAGLEGKIISEQILPNPFSDTMENLKGGIYKTCNIFYRKQILDEVGGFNEAFSGAFREDADLAFRVLKRGYKIVFSPDLLVMHKFSPGFIVPFRLAKRYFFDPLLYVEHPKLYKEKIEVNNLGRVKLARPKQAVYQLYTLSFIILLAAIFFDIKSAIYPLASFFILCYLSVLTVAWRLWNGKFPTFLNMAYSAFVYFFIPFVYTFYIIKGTLVYRLFKKGQTK